MNYNFSAGKNAWLMIERGIGFEEIVEAIEAKQVLDVYKHPNKEKYPDQWMMIVSVKGYAYVVPFVEQENGTVFLKTIYPSRKAKKDYLRGEVYES